MSTLDDGLEELVRRAVRAELAQLIDELVAKTAPASTVRPLESLLSVEQVAALCPPAKTETVRAWCRSGSLHARKAGRRWVIRREDLEAFLVEQRSVEARALAPAAVAEDFARRLRGGGQR